MKKSTIILSSLLIIVTLITFFACNKEKGADTVISETTDRKPFAITDLKTGQTTYNIDIDLITAKLNKQSSSKDESDRYVVESIEIIDNNPSNPNEVVEIRIIIIDTENGISGTAWLMKDFSHKIIDAQQTKYYLDQNVSTGIYEFAYREENRLFVVHVNGSNYVISEENPNDYAMLPRWLLFCQSMNCKKCTKNGSFWNAGCNPCDPPGTCTGILAPWVVPTITTIGSIIIAIL